MKPTLLACLFFALVSNVFSQTADCVSGDVRINEVTSGTSMTGEISGGVDICIGGQWMATCDETFGVPEAMVTCRQLGYAAERTTFENAVPLQPGSSTIPLTSGCTGNETSLISCYNIVTGCTPSVNAITTCFAKNFTCSRGDIRLVGGNSTNKGTVQVCLNNKYGTICDQDQSFDNKAAAVTCGYLGFPRQGALALSMSVYGMGGGPILLTSVHCNGTERNLTECSSSTVVDSCIHLQDVGVLCKPSIAACTNGNVRLVGGPNQYGGRVEICFNGEWGTVCGDQWSDSNADLVCSALGYVTPGSIGVGGAFFGEGTGVIFADTGSCLGNASSTANCIANSYCSHQSDAGVFCVDPSTWCNITGSVRLRDGTFPSQGRVEVCVKSHWVTVCDNTWDSNAATVVCSQLGYRSTTGEPPLPVTNSYFGQGKGLVLVTDVTCVGNEASLLDCGHLISTSSCGHSSEAGVLCPVGNTAVPGCPCHYGDVRLQNGSTASEGRVEVCINCEWGTVCDNWWNDAAATVVCNQLGFKENGFAVGGGFFPQGNGLLIIDSVDCMGSENTIVNCTIQAPSFCSHFADAGVICLGGSNSLCKTGALRLAGTAYGNAGRVEICINNQWGTVCGFLWDNNAAQVVCRQLGYNGSLPLAVYGYQFEAGSGPIYLNPYCTGLESSLLDCPRTTIFSEWCSHYTDAGVVCVNSNCSQNNSGPVLLTSAYHVAVPVAIGVPLAIIAIVLIAILLVVILFLGLRYRSKATVTLDQVAITKSDVLAKSTEQPTVEYSTM